MQSKLTNPSNSIKIKKKKKTKKHIFNLHGALCYLLGRPVHLALAPLLVPVLALALVLVPLPAGPQHTQPLILPLESQYDPSKTSLLELIPQFHSAKKDNNEYLLRKKIQEEWQKTEKNLDT